MTEDIKKQEEKLVKSLTFSFICFVIVFFFLFYALSIILFIGLFPIISDIIINLISNINGYHVCIISLFFSIITVFYFIVKDIKNIMNN